MNESLLKNPQPVAILGATGMVGQKTITLLEEHLDFEVRELVASRAKTGLRYADGIQRWFEKKPLSKEIAEMKISSYEDIESQFVISALPAEQAKEIEPYLAAKGHYVFSNASTHRMKSNIPLLIPEINSEHLSLLERQPTKGKIITNPNCAVVFTALAIAPLRTLGQLEHMSLFTMQAVSGAGYPGVSAFDILGNVIPFIPNEEEKLATECQKILGVDFSATVNANRVPVLHGHTMVIHLNFKEAVDVLEAQRILDERTCEMPHLYRLYPEGEFPIPSMMADEDCCVHIGRVKQDQNPKVLSLVAMGHNLIRGAAGAAIRNMEFTVAHLMNQPELAEIL